MGDFYENVMDWATARNILAEGLAKSKLGLAKDAIGDCAVTTTNMISRMGLDSIQIGGLAQSMAVQSTDSFDQYDVDGLMNLFIRHIAIIRPVGTAPLPFDIIVPTPTEYHATVALAALQHCAQRLGLTFDECQSYAWDEIKDRNGAIINGTFVKEADLVTTLNAVVSAALKEAISEVYTLEDGGLGAVELTLNNKLNVALGSLLDTPATLTLEREPRPSITASANISVCGSTVNVTTVADVVTFR